MHFQKIDYEAKRLQNIDEKNQFMGGLKIKSTKEALKAAQNRPKKPKKAKISVETRKSSRKRNKIDYSDKENIAPPKKVEKSAVEISENQETQEKPESIPEDQEKVKPNSMSI